MTDKPSVRINKVLRELNISLDRVSEFLINKKINIDIRPTSKITNEVYQVLLDEFSGDKSDRVASDEISEVKRKEKEEKENIRIAQEENDQLQKENVFKKEKIDLFRKPIHKPKMFGKIDLDKKKNFKIKELKKEDLNDKKTESEPEKIKKQIINKDSEGKNLITEEKNTVVESEKINETVKTNYQKLSGPVKTGEKLNIDEINKKEKNIEDARKRKRRRISKDPKKNQTVSDKNISSKKPLNKKRDFIKKEEPSEEEVQKQIRETLEKLQGSSSKSKGAKYRKDKRDQHRIKSEEELEQIKEESKVLKVTEFITASEVATMMEVNTTEIISACMSLGIMVTMNQRLDAETLTIVAEEFGYEVSFEKAESEEDIIVEEKDDEKDLKTRHPIVTVMGHVDHGKTSLLDYIRKENVIAGESGGITQHIGAYSVELENNQKITFLDTPGHEAFTAMRARGAQVTDIAIIVIAADDNIMPQTKEAISHAQAANVPIVFAINKIDRPNSNPEKIKESLAGMNLMVEDWGGKIQSHDISALKGT